MNIFIHTLHRSALHFTTGNPQTIKQSQLNEYPERALLLANSDDYIILNHAPDVHYLEYLIEMGIGTRHLLIPKNQGSSLCDNVLKDKPLLSFLQTLKKTVLHPYISTPAEILLAQKIHATLHSAPPELTLKINNKRYLPTLLEKLALPVPDYKIANVSTVIETARAFKEKVHNIIIIGEHSYGGFAVWPIKSEEDLNIFAGHLHQCHHNECFLVEKMYDVSYSVNIQYNIGLDVIQDIGMTDQILDEQLKHHGNMYPSSAQHTDTIKQYAYAICDALKLQGYRGLLGIDLIETTEGKVFAVDLNGRVNASSFGLYVIRKLFPETYLQKHFKILSHLNIEKRTRFITLKKRLGVACLFNKNTGSGILPYNIGLLPWGFFSGIVIGETQQEIEQCYNDILLITQS